MNEQAIKDLAREYTRRTLAQSATFQQLGIDDQKALYLDVYRQNCQQLSAPAGAPRARQQALHSRALADPKKASEMIADKRPTNKRIDEAGELAGGFIDEVDFPGFVRDLLKGVFDANLEVTLAQMESYQRLLAEAMNSYMNLLNAPFALYQKNLEALGRQGE